MAGSLGGCKMLKKEKKQFERLRLQGDAHAAPV